MKAEEFVALLSDISKRNEYRFRQIGDCLPLGIDGMGNIVIAHRDDCVERYHHTCVTGSDRRDFILRMLLTQSCLYNKSDAQFFILSPYTEYAELLRLKEADVTVPYIRNMADYHAALDVLRDLVRMRREKSNYPRLFVAADGLEELPDAPADNTRGLYRLCFDAVGTCGVQIITGVDLSGSIFGGYPGAFVGAGNSFIVTKPEGKADITYVNADSTLTSPKEFMYPSEPSVAETVEGFNEI